MGLTTLPPLCADCLEIWEPQPPGALWDCQACNGIALPLPFIETGMGCEAQDFASLMMMMMMMTMMLLMMMMMMMTTTTTTTTTIDSTSSQRRLLPEEMSAVCVELTTAYATKLKNCL